MQTVRGHLFIIPNAVAVEGDRYHSTMFKDLLEMSRRIFGKPGATHFVQVAYTSPACDNWAAHRWPEYPQLFAKIPTHIPVECLDGKREGDEFCFEFEGLRIELRLDQLNYRYAWTGTFEATLQKLVEKAASR